MKGVALPNDVTDDLDARGDIVGSERACRVCQEIPMQLLVVKLGLHMWLVLKPFCRTISSRGNDYLRRMWERP